MSQPHQLVVYTYLLNADLACMSAEKTIKEVMGHTDLISLSRYTKWVFEYDSDIENPKAFKDVLEKSYYILNANKEKYTLNQLPKSKTLKDEIEIIAEVTLKEEPKNTQSLKKIQTKVSIPIRSIKKSTLWKLRVKKGKKSIQELVHSVEKRMVYTKTFNNGLLVNPIYETATLSYQ